MHLLVSKALHWTLGGFARFFYPALDPYPVKSKGSPYSITERRVPELIRNDQFSAEWDAKPQANQSINQSIDDDAVVCMMWFRLRGTIESTCFTALSSLIAVP